MTNEFSLENAIALLSRTPATLDSLLRGLPDFWTQCSEGDNTWTAFEVVGHLIHGERTDWMPRVKRILESGESRPFDAFDREGHTKAIQGKSMGRLLDEFAQARKENLAALRAMKLGPVDFEKRGLHPALGTCTLSQLLATWAAHDLTHVHQISRIMAHQYQETVGPWGAYLGVMHCKGHGA